MVITVSVFFNPGNSGFDEWFSEPNFFDNDPDRLENMSEQIEDWMEFVIGSLNGEDY